MINVNSFQSLGAVDGPGVRVVVFLQGCNIKCKYCHNPETLEKKDSTLYTEQELFEKIDRFKSYIKESGGVTFSGGEPLLQAKELIPLCRLLKKEGYHIALDTNGSILNEDVKKLLDYVDLVLLDLKMPDKALYYEYTRCDFDSVMNFFNYLVSINKSAWIRQVIVEGVNTTDENIAFLKDKIKYSNVEKLELLPFKKICASKYEALNKKFEMLSFPETSKETIQKIYDKTTR